MAHPAQTFRKFKVHPQAGTTEQIAYQKEREIEALRAHLTIGGNYITIWLLNRMAMENSRLDATFLALGDPTRRAILARLAGGEASVAELAAPFAMSQPAISKHLKVLERAGLSVSGTTPSGAPGGSRPASGRGQRVARAVSRDLGAELPASRRTARGTAAHTRPERQARRRTKRRESSVRNKEGERDMPMTIEEAQVTMPSDREVMVTRSFKAPRALVFRAYTEPRLVRRWMLGPPGWSMPVCEMDVRAGGRYRWRWRNDTDGKEFGFAGSSARCSRHRGSCTPKDTIPARWGTAIHRAARPSSRRRSRKRAASRR